MIISREFLVVLLCTVAAIIAEELHPLSDEFIDLINSQQKFWRAGRNFPEHTPLSHIKNLLGALEDKNFSNYPCVEHDAELIANLPESFDPRDKWPNCPSLNQIRDQGSCGSCWAVGAVAVMTDRYCIYSNGTKQFHFSAQDLTSCCSECGLGCLGGLSWEAWVYWRDTGIVSGGNYNSGQGCRPYEVAACEHTNNAAGKLPHCGKTVLTRACVKSCHSNYDTEYDKDKRRGKIIYRVPSDEEQIKVELFKNGPVQAAFSVYADFGSYRDGVYRHTKGSKLGNHAIKILGWGVENGLKYWLVANSWNTHWGDKGYFKILRGENHCGIEGEVVAGEPLIE
ncbi:hypothetical protein PYW08_016576 [Mythimna loreyi]|uniref:Uncharacterized protein n=1 Tax=Mythimna loreyi TaxID=667449 RepID=A0ACC2R1P7_9NEOP|nr:hypothetical protein PYW08_016576 [Mythimna loreyi]